MVPEKCELVHPPICPKFFIFPRKIFSKNIIFVQKIRNACHSIFSLANLYPICPVNVSSTLYSRLHLPFQGHMFLFLNPSSQSFVAFALNIGPKFNEFFHIILISLAFRLNIILYALYFNNRKKNLRNAARRSKQKMLRFEWSNSKSKTEVDF